MMEREIDREIEVESERGLRFKMVRSTEKILDYSQ